ncbi:MAG: hypothetical protein ACLPYZ_15670 [Limisphaerales bacterium]
MILAACLEMGAELKTSGYRSGGRQTAAIGQETKIVRLSTESRYARFEEV